MPVIDPKGLFEGQRLAACSDIAQLYWPRFFCATNGHARLELHYPLLVSRCFHSFTKVPTEEQVFAVFAEFAENFLVIPYQAEGQVWVQFATEEKFLRRYKTADDKLSPAPPASSLETFAVGYSAWKAKRQAEANHGDVSISKIFPKYFGNTSETFPSGIGIGVGVGSGSGDGEKPFAQSDQEHRSVQVPTVFDLPLIGGKQYGVPQKLYDEYIKAFPGVSVMDELAKLRVWLLSNPKRMKTLTGMPRCMNSWLSKAQNNQPHGRSNYGNLPVGKADRNLAVLNEVLGRGQRQDGLDEVGLLEAGGDGSDDS